MIEAVKAIFEAFKEPFSALGRWLNPDRRREARLRRAIEAAEEIIKILKKQNGYGCFREDKLRQYENHYQKQFDAWKNG
jgi:hypothetical protein